MRTERLQAENPADLERAAQLLRQGGVVAFPTETVYGLGANALSAAAVEQIFVAKQRPHWDPLIVHIADREALGGICSSSPLADRLIEAFWPGPLTLLLRRTEAIPGCVTAGRALVGVRWPAHPVARQLLRLAGLPIAAPSANRFGHISPTTAAHVLDDLDGRIDAVVDGGATEVGVESTVAEVRDGSVVIYRAGAITGAMLEAVPGVERVSLYRADEDNAALESLPSPGVGIRHYAPRAQMMLVRDQLATPAGYPGALQKAAQSDLRIGVMLPHGWDPGAADVSFAWGQWDDSAELARRLFAGLRSLDEAGVDVIVCPLPPAGGLGDALRDRLEKAARKNRAP